MYKICRYDTGTVIFEFGETVAECLMEGAKKGINFFRANLRGANLQWANPQWANLRGANLDFSCWPLWCGGLGVITDERLRIQKAYHLLDDIVTAIKRGEATDEEKAIARVLAPYANRIHRTEVPRIEV